MVHIPKFPTFREQINREYKKFAAAFSDTWFIVILAHILGIGLGVVLCIAAAHAPSG